MNSRATSPRPGTPPPPIPNSYWLPGAWVCAGEYPGHWSARERIGRLLDAGIRAFVDLTEERDPLDSYDRILQAEADRRQIEVTWIRMGVRDMDIPSPERMSAILDHIDGEIEAGRPVYVHCWGGVGRTGTVVGCHFVRHGCSGTTALDRIAKLWRTMSADKRSSFPESPQTTAQRAFVRDWAEGEAGAPDTESPPSP